MLQNFRKNLARIIFPEKNSMSVANDFLKYGNRDLLTPEWADVIMSDRDHYTGYSYAAITKRARAVARVASEKVKTKLPDESKKDIEHPYLTLIKDSTDFSVNTFWTTISTYLDLEGVFYLLIIRNASEGRIGAPNKFKLLNPYNIQRVLKKDTLEVGGYIETRKGFQRELPAEMVIPIRELNPFDEDKPFAMTDAASDSAFTLKSAGDFTRQTLKNNKNAPGIVNTDVVLESEKFDNFVARVKAKKAGEYIFSNGGAVSFTPMTVDISKVSLKDINEMNRDPLFAVSGMSKTMMGIEQSGTTRETANVQKDLFIENEVVPRINTIIDALNLDYKISYSQEYNKSKVIIAIDNPIESDQDIEQKKVDIKKTDFELYQSLLDKGYDEVTASHYVNGEIGLDGLGKPKNPPKPVEVTDIKDEKDKKDKDVKKNEHEHDHVVVNKLPNGVILDQQSLLQNAIVNIEQQLLVDAINRIPKKIKNGIEEEKDVITDAEKREVQNELILVLTAFYGIIYTLQGNEVAKDRAKEYKTTAKFILDSIAKKGINQTAKMVAESHVDTVANDIFETARDAALQGKSQREVIGILKNTFNDEITEGRAKTIARTETNRAFTNAQYEADRQFIKQNKLEGKAYKIYNTRSLNPCEFCKALAKQGKIPFDEPFVKKGDSVTTTVDGKEKTIDVKFESVFAGNLHPNCSCDYILVIEG